MLKKSYTDLCSNSIECDDSLGLICQSTGTACNCPSSNPNAMCDCIKVIGNEYFWNGTMCQQAFAYNDPCQDSTTNYMCQSLTQLTSCNALSGNFLCGCIDLQFFNGTCNNQRSINGSCINNGQCLTINGLSCINGLCRYTRVSKEYFLFLKMIFQLFKL